MLFRDRAIIHLETVDSTNNYAARLVRMSPPPEGSVITAQFQTHGRGQRNAHWESKDSENLLCSVILYPEFLRADDQFEISRIVSLAIAETLEECVQKEIRIKWPNDIFIGNKKICGILIEAAWSDKKMTSAIVGIGLNINQQSFSIPTATSLRLESGRSWDIPALLEKLLGNLEKYYIRLKSGSFPDIHKAYEEALYRLNEEALFISNGAEFTARIKGVDNRGRLGLEMKDGKIQFFELREIAMKV